MVNNDTLHMIKKRRSTRSFKSEQITTEELKTVLEAGMWAPSAGNQQAWHFTVIQNHELLASLNREAKESAKQLDNEHIKKMASNEQFNIFHNAPTVILVSGQENAMVIEADCAAATQNMLLAAESIGLGSCWINFVLFAFHGPNAAEFLQKIDIPEGYKPFSSVALGYKKIEAVNAPQRKPNLVNYIK